MTHGRYHRLCRQAGTVLRKSPKKSAKDVNHVLLGTWLKVVDTDGDWLGVETWKAGKNKAGVWDSFTVPWKGKFKES